MGKGGGKRGEGYFLSSPLDVREGGEGETWGCGRRGKRGRGERDGQPTFHSLRLRKRKGKGGVHHSIHFRLFTREDGEVLEKKKGEGYLLFHPDCPGGKEGGVGLPSNYLE